MYIAGCLNFIWFMSDVRCFETCTFVTLKINHSLKILLKVFFNTGVNGIQEPFRSIDPH